MSNRLDHHVIQNFHKGDRTAFEQVFKAYYNCLIVFTDKITLDHGEAEDITTETFLKLFQRYSQFKDEVTIRAFLYITARNSCLNYLKGVKRHSRTHIELAKRLENDYWLELQYEVMPELVEAVHKAIDKLPGECKKIFKMLYYEGLKPAEVAAILEISVNTVYVQKKRAIDMLRLRLGEDDLL